MESQDLIEMVTAINKLTRDEILAEKAVKEEKDGKRNDDIRVGATDRQ